MSTFQSRARDLIPIGIALALVAVCALACRDQREPVTQEEKETWDATALFLAGVFAVSKNSFEDRHLVVGNFWANYDWIKDVFLPHLRGTPPHDWQECPICNPAVEKLTNGDKELKEEVRPALAQSPEKTESQ